MMGNEHDWTLIASNNIRREQHCPHGIHFQQEGGGQSLTAGRVRSPDQVPQVKIG